MYRIDFWTLWEKVRVGCFNRTASKHVYYQGWNRSPAQIGWMRQVLWAGALGRPRGMGWRGRREGGSGWGTHVNPWLIYVSVWQKPLQYCKVISLQLIKINGKRKKKEFVLKTLRKKLWLTDVSWLPLNLSRCPLWGRVTCLPMVSMEDRIWKMKEDERTIPAMSSTHVVPDSNSEPKSP